jgi:hypothetical protein
MNIERTIVHIDGYNFDRPAKKHSGLPIYIVSTSAVELSKPPSLGRRNETSDLQSMADIKYTLSRDTRYRAETPEQEREWLARVHELFYALPTKPLHAARGDYVYFIHDGKVKARAQIVDVVRGVARFTYTDRRRDAAPYDLKVKPPMEIAKRPFSHKGFQGYRYVTSAEAGRFRKAFD